MDIFFNGIWRMDWGLGNPNNTAALIATLMIGVWAVAFIRKWGFWIALPLSTASGACLVHTFSRGGIIAAFIGFLPLLWYAPRPWRRARIIGAVLGVWAVIGFALYLNAHERYCQGIVQEDKSITNRFRLWKHAPMMIADAPGGWGIGNAAETYMQWYQPLEDTENYRTFVNSHLQWLIEFGWPARFLYVFGWGAALLVCLPSKKSRNLAVAFGVWLAFAVAAFFSSVGESGWVWAVPCISLAAALIYRLTTQNWPNAAFWSVPVVVPILFGVSIWILGSMSPRTPKVTRVDSRTIIGSSTPATWVMVDKPTLGDKYGKTLRLFLQSKPVPKSIGIVSAMAELPADLSDAAVVISGPLPELDRPKIATLATEAKELVLLGPGFYPQETGLRESQLKSIRVTFGEFSQSPYFMAWQGLGQCDVVPAAADYLASWPELAY